MARLFAIHQIDENGKFNGRYYRTFKSNVRVGDQIYIISSNGSPPVYSLEGLFEVTSIDSFNGSSGKIQLNLAKRLGKQTSPSISGQIWYNREEFRNQFARGQSMISVPPEYDERFLRLLDLNEEEARDSYLAIKEDAICDFRSDVADRALSIGVRYKRDANVRAEVLRRANGKCEYCGKPGFLTPSGTRYLEAHHIIALARDGADRTSNVIGLCPEHHRIAHFGVEADQIENEMIAIVSKFYEQ